MPDSSIRKQIEQRIYHPQPCSQNRDQSDTAGHLMTVSLSDWSLNSHRLNGQIFGGIDTNEHGEAINGGPKVALARWIYPAPCTDGAQSTGAESQ